MIKELFLCPYKEKHHSPAQPIEHAFISTDEFQRTLNPDVEKVTRQILHEQAWSW